MTKVSAETHEKIMEAAKELVSDKGRSNVTIAEVIRQAKVSKATIYRDLSFLEWWKTTSETPALRTCPDCIELSEFKERAVKQKTQIRELEESLSRTTAALVALSRQLKMTNSSNVQSLPLGRSENRMPFT